MYLIFLNQVNSLYLFSKYLYLSYYDIMLRKQSLSFLRNMTSAVSPSLYNTVDFPISKGLFTFSISSCSCFSYPKRIFSFLLNPFSPLLQSYIFTPLCSKSSKLSVSPISSSLPFLPLESTSFNFYSLRSTKTTLPGCSIQ